MIGIGIGPGFGAAAGPLQRLVRAVRGAGGHLWLQDRAVYSAGILSADPWATRAAQPTYSGLDNPAAWSLGAGWSIANGVATHTGGGTNLSQACVVPGSRFAFDWDLVALSSGTVTPGYGTGGVARSAPGTYSDEITSSIGTVGWYANGDASVANLRNLRNLSVTTWRDRITGAELAQATAEAQGWHIDAGGRGAVRFAAGDSMAWTPGAAIDAWTIYAVLNPDAVVAQQFPLGINATTAGLVVESSTVRLFDGSSTLTGPAVSAGQPQIVTLSRSGTDYAVRVNAGQVVSGTLAGVALSKLTVGNRGGADKPFAGVLRGLILAPAAIAGTATDTAILRDLATLCGVSL